MRTLLCFLLVLAWVVPAMAAPSEIEVLKHHDPLRLTLEEPLPGKLIVGLRLPLRLVIRNITGEPGSNQAAVAVVLRGVAWHGYRTDERTWARPVYGDVREQADGTLVFERVPRRSEVRVESAVLFPGQQVTVDMPFTPQRAGRQKVDVTYGVVGGFERWGRDIWLVSASDARYTLWPFATPDAVAALGAYAQPAVVRQSMRLAGPPLELRYETWSVDLAVRPDLHGVATGGLNAAQALERVGWAEWQRSHPQQQVWSYWRPVLKAWVFVRDDGTAAALRLGEATPEKLPRMAPTVPDAFGVAPDSATDMLLRPEVFVDLVEVRRPLQSTWYDAGVTRVPAAALWAVLRRAQSRGLDLTIETYDPNGLGNEQAISAGVRVDHQGQWLPVPVDHRH